MSAQSQVATCRSECVGEGVKCRLSHPFPLLYLAGEACSIHGGSISALYAQFYLEVQGIPAPAFSKELRTESSISSQGRIWFQLKFGWDAKISPNRDRPARSIVEGPPINFTGQPVPLCTNLTKLVRDASGGDPWRDAKSSETTMTRVSS